jgi:hypothetical protein
MTRPDPLLSRLHAAIAAIVAHTQREPAWLLQISAADRLLILRALEVELLTRPDREDVTRH